MIDPADKAANLTDPQKRRLIEIAKAQKALPWRARTDDRLLKLGLIGKMGGVLDEPLASIGRDGWTVLNWMNRTQK